MAPALRPVHESYPPMEKILVTGGSGLLGSKIVELAKRDYEVIPTHYSRAIFPDSVKLDVTNKDQFSHTVKRFMPDVVIHAAAQTNVDLCETNREEARAVNAIGTRNVSEVCAEIDAKLIYLSTDYVFDGERGMYSENDRPNPVNYYGLTKLEGEKFVRDLCKKYLIIRSSGLYGWHLRRRNFFTWVTDSLRAGKRIDVVIDCYNSPTLASNLAEVLLTMVEKGSEGIFHVAGSERINRYDFAIKIAKKLGLEEKLIGPVKSEDLKTWVATRPKDSSLNIDKIRDALGVRLLGTDQGLSVMAKQSQKP